MQLERRLQSTQQQMKDAEDEYEKAERRLQDQLRETKEQLNTAQRVFITLVLHAHRLRCHIDDKLCVSIETIHVLIPSHLELVPLKPVVLHNFKRQFDC